MEGRSKGFIVHYKNPKPVSTKASKHFKNASALGWEFIRGNKILIDFFKQQHIATVGKTDKCELV